MLINLLNPNYNLPRRHKLTNTSVPLTNEKLLNETKIKIKEEAISVCLTTDCWTSINNAIQSTNRSIIDEWQLNDKIVLVVSDNATYIKSATTNLQLKHFKCFAHSLNLIVQETIVGNFKRKISGKTPTKLLLYIATRRNSTFHRLDRFVELETTVKATVTIMNADLHILTPEEWKTCKELCPVLKQFDEVTKII
ncbi:hypothetical protein AGLY_008013 [Aphis glycines]|uniref:DUF659 domain-containing protein n=1 Tax=Aphis glycines TaxID=307491 RepID=A0A6G0TM49_APHGL|nr:hypothetical protein AGLY_008013 [Aphis glycines]